jgi:RNA polymerase sigma-70 factor, ECF subfamily
MGLISSDFGSQIKVRQSDISAFESLFKGYYSKLCHFASGIIHDMDAAEEIVQEFFYNYWKNRETIIIRLSVKSYFYSSIRYQCIKYLEQQDVRRRYIDRMKGLLTEENENTQLEEIQVRELEMIFNRALSELPERCKLIFRMSRIEGKKYQQIADELSVSIKTVEANMTRALQLLRENLAEYQKEPVIKKQ